MKKQQHASSTKYRAKHDGGYGFGPEGPPMIVVEPLQRPTAKYVPERPATKKGLFLTVKEFIWRIM